MMINTGLTSFPQVSSVALYRELQGEDAGLNGRGHHYGRDRDPIGPQPPGRAGLGSGTGKDDDGNDLCTL
jgi:hypothetical protein